MPTAIAYEDKALVKALDGLKNASNNVPRQLAALADLDKQIQPLLKIHKTDKALQTIFKEMWRAAAELQQALLAMVRRSRPCTPCWPTPANKWA